MSIMPPDPDSKPEVSSPETAALVLEHLRENPTASVRSIAAALGIGHTTAHRAVARLLADGSVRVVRMGTGHRYPSRYEISSGRSDSDRNARIDELGRALVWDALHQYALDRKAWLCGEAPTDGR